MQLFIRLLLCFFLFVLASFYSQATHIVGGQIEAKHISGIAYEVKLVLYFDAINGDPAARDTSIQVAAYQTSNNQLIDFFTLRLKTDTPVPYTNPACKVGNIKTQKMVYLDTISFRASGNGSYTDTQGFYLVWERCCRNATVTNIVRPMETGTVFYLAMPPINIEDYDSSPAFNPIIGDYGCTNRLFKMDFSATDADGDSLTYRLDTPLAGSTFPNPGGFSPFPTPAPYRLITWPTGYSLANIIKGSTLPLQINATEGSIYVVATLPGLYAFAVVCEEYRNKIKIGEVRREFQLPMLFCPIKPGPHLNFDDKVSNADTLNFKLGTKVCTSATVIDTIQNTQLSIYTVYPKGVSNASATASPSNYVVNALTDTSQLSFCINGYLLPSAKPYVYRLIVKDDACSTPNTDTLTFYVNVTDTLTKPKPVVKDPLPDSGYVVPNMPVVIVVEIDTSGNQIDSSCKALVEVSVSGSNVPSNAEITVVDNKVTIKWIPDCKISEDSTIVFKVYVGNQDCITPYRDSTLIKLKVRDLNIGQNKPIPNIITPNGDGKNEEFAVSEYLVENCKGGFEGISIFNRWGSLLFETKDYQFRWKADDTPDGLYYYAIQYQGNNLKGYILVAR